MVQLYTSEAYLIKQIELPEMDRLGVFYTKDYGKQTLLLKGIKKTQSKLQYRVYDWSYSEIEFVIGKSMGRLIAIQDHLSYQHKIDSLKHISALSVLFEIIDTLTDENHPDQQIFSVIQEYSDAMYKLKPNIVGWISWLIIRVFFILGLGVNMSHCVLSGDTKASGFGLSVRSGGLVKQELAHEVDDYIPLTTKEIILIRRWQKGIVPQDSETIPWKSIQSHLQWYSLSISSLEEVQFI